ncbi:hypothetical protein F5Y03DRAFT_283962 [Xylaria venustula]|nr:hypothetical protein F5Y03DRAFT_283962 [Xylaria venustula]
MAGLIPRNVHTDGIGRMVIEFSTSMDGQCVIGMSTISAPSMHACGGTEIEIVVKEPEVSPDAICITPTSPLAPANRLPSSVPAPAPQDQTPAWWTTTSWPADPGAATPPKPKPNNPDPPAMQVPTIPVKEDPAVPSVGPPAQTQTQPAETSCSDSHPPDDPTQGSTPSPTPVPVKEQPAVSSSSSVSTLQSSSSSTASSSFSSSTSLSSTSSSLSSTPSTLITTTSTPHISSSSTSSTVSTSSTPHTRSVITKTITSTLRPPPSTSTTPTPTPTLPDRPQQPPRPSQTPSQSQPPAPTPTPTECESGYTSIDLSTLTGLDPHFFEKYISLLGLGHILDDVVNSVSNTLDGLGLSQWRQSGTDPEELIHEFRVRCDVDIPEGPTPVFPPEFEEHREQIIVMGHGHRDCLEMCERQVIDMAGTGVFKECIGAAYRGGERGRDGKGECRF